MLIRLRSFSPSSSATRQARSASGFCRSTSCPDVDALTCTRAFRGSASRRTLRSGDTGPNGNTMKELSVALLVSMISLVGCAGPAELFFRNSIVVDHLDGNYQRL